MDYWGILKQSLRIVRTERGLWGFGALSAAQSLLATVVFVAIGGLSGIVGALGQEIALGGLGGSSSPGRLTRLAVAGYDLIVTWLPAIVGVSVVVMLGWLVFAILDVAASGGAISQADTVLRGGRASFREGMGFGFSRWGRIAALLAVTAAPLLVGALAQALATLATITLPLMRDSAPSLSAIWLANQSASGIASLASIVAVPLGVIVMIALRGALLEDLTWRAALGSAWHVCVSRFADVALMYLVLLVAALIAGVAFGLALAVVVAVAGTAAGVAYFSEAVIGAIVIGVLGLVAMVALSAVLQGAFNLVFSVTYTVFWRALTDSPVPTLVLGTTGATEGEL